MFACVWWSSVEFGTGVSPPDSTLAQPGRAPEGHRLRPQLGDPLERAALVGRVTVTVATRSGTRS
jgi:hypothetical protein